MRVGVANTAKRQSYTINDFRGVDYSSSPLEVASYRATDIANFELVDGVLHKRKGWEQVQKLTNDEILSVYAYSDEYMLVQTYHPNDSYYNNKVTAYKKENGLWKAKSNSEFTLKERVPAKYYKRGAMVYIVCGRVESFTVKIVDLDEKAVFYAESPRVPTTTINILPELVVENTNRTELVEVDGVNKEVLESANLLEPRRNNELYFDVGKDAQERYYYYLDDSIYCDEKPDYDGGVFPTIDFYNADGTSTGSVTDFVLQYDRNDGYSWKSDSYNLILYQRDRKRKTGKLEIVCTDVYPEIEEIKRNATRIVVTFTPLEEGERRASGKYDIKGVIASTTFGADGRDDRLFIGGSEEYPNAVYYSEKDDFTYFPANQQLILGEADAKITSFLRISDGTLAAFKKTTNPNQPSVYFTTGKSVSLGVSEEGIEYFNDLFTVTSGNIGEAGVSPSATVNLSGDTLFVSSTGVYGVELSQNYASIDRYAKERSRSIRSKLVGRDLSSASAIVYQDRLYLAVGDGEVFVADSRYKYALEGNVSDTFTYEWFRHTGIPANTWFIQNEELWFATKDGWFCRFKNDYGDTYKSQNGELTAEGGFVTVAPSLLDVVKKSAYAVDKNGNKWYFTLIDNRFEIPNGIPVADGDISLSFVVPVEAFWQSKTLDLGSNIARKNLWSIAISTMPSEKGRVDLGYRARQNYVTDIKTVGFGANAFDFGNIDFSMFSFDSGGFANAFRQRIFEHGVMYIQTVFRSDSVGDCIVNSVTIEFAEANKLIGAG